MTSIYVSLKLIWSQFDPIPANFYMNGKSSCQTPGVETTSKDNSPPKISRAIICFVCRYLIISLEKLSQFQLTVCVFVLTGLRTGQYDQIMRWWSSNPQSGIATVLDSVDYCYVILPRLN